MKSPESKQCRTQTPLKAQRRAVSSKPRFVPPVRLLLLPWSFPFMLRFETAGESHGECLVATLTGLPAGVPVSLPALDRELSAYRPGGERRVANLQAASGFCCGRQGADGRRHHRVGGGAGRVCLQIGAMNGLLAQTDDMTGFLGRTPLAQGARELA